MGCQPDLCAILQLFVGVLNKFALMLHHSHAGRGCPMDQHGQVKVAFGEHRANRFQMTSNGVATWVV